MIMSSNNATFLSNDSVLYNLQQTGITGILIRFASKEFTENSTLPQFSSNDVPNNILLYNKEAKLFIPACELLYLRMCVCMYA